VVQTHNAALDLITEVGREARIPLCKEKTIKLFNGPLETYRADLFLPGGIPRLGNRPVALDVTITNPLVATEITGASKTSGSAAASGEKTKDNRLLKPMEELGYNFLPLSFETFSGVGERSKLFFDFLLTQLHYQLRLPFAEVAQTFWQRLSILIQRFKAQTIRRVILILARSKAFDVLKPETYGNFA
jgi:hypothetical protein